MLEWFNNFNRREQMVMLFGSIAVVFYLLYILVFAPIFKTQSELALQNDRARETIKSVRALAAEYKSLKGSGASAKRGSSQTLSQIVDSTVASNSLQYQRFQPNSNGEAQIRFEGAVFNNIIAWLYQVESNYGLAVKDISISPGKSSGFVDVSVRLRKAG